MRIVLYSAGYLPEPRQQRIRSWVAVYRNALRSEGLAADFFHPYQQKLSKEDLVHVFGFSQPENWYWLKRLAAGVVLSPLPEESGWEEFPFRSRAALAIQNAASKLRRIRLALGPQLFLSSLDAAVNFGEAPNWPLTLPSSARKITSPLDPTLSAQRMLSLYASLGKN